MPISGEPASSIRDNPAVKDAPRHDDQLEQSIEDSFPASDPPAVTQPAKPAKGSRAAADDGIAADVEEGSSPEAERSLDDSLDDSFPASDPPSMTQPPGETVGAPARPKPAPGERRVADFLKPPQS